MKQTTDTMQAEIDAVREWQAMPKEEQNQLKAVFDTVNIGYVLKTIETGVKND